MRHVTGKDTFIWLSAAVFGLVAISLSLPERFGGVRFARQDGVPSPSASVPESSLRKPFEPYTVPTCWDPSNEYGCGADAWEWRIKEAGNEKTFVVGLGGPDEDGEVRFLSLRNASGTVFKVGELSKGLTYASTFSEFDGSPVNTSPETLGRERAGGFFIEAYPVYPVGLFEKRLPAVVKYTSIPPELF